MPVKRKTPSRQNNLPPRPVLLPRDVDPAARSRFVEEYLLDLDPKAAALRADIPAEVARRLLALPRVQEAIALAKRRRASHTQIYADEVLRRWWALATADPRELVELRRVACRYCHGHDHRYQFTREELRQVTKAHHEAMMKLNEQRRVPLDEQGGDGYDARADPAEDCPECFGEGQPSVYLHDTRTLGPGAALLYQGVKVSKDGSVEIKMRDQDRAMDSVAQHLGLKIERRVSIEFDPARMSDEQLESALAAFGAMSRGEPPHPEGTSTSTPAISGGPIEDHSC